MVSTKQTAAPQTALADASGFSGYSNFDELDEYGDSLIGESGLDPDYDSQFDTVEEIEVEAGAVGSDAPPEEVDLLADAALEAGDESDNYDDYLPEGLGFDDSSEFDEYAPEEVAEVEPAIEVNAVDAAAVEPGQPEEFEGYGTPPAGSTGSEFDGIDEFDYQPELEVDAAEPAAAPALDLEAELESDAEVEEAGYDPDPEVDAEEADEFIDPRVSRSKVSLSGNPLMKAAFIGALGLVVVLIGGSLYSLLSSGGQVKDQAAVNLETTPEPVVAELPESGKLKAELAFSSQQNDLEKARRLQQGQVKTSPTPNATPTPQDNVVLAPEPLPLPLPMMPTVPAPTMPEMAAAAGSSDPYADLSPIERWQAIASMGSFGRANPSARPATVAAVPVAPSAPVAPPGPARPVSSSNSLSQIRSAASTPGMRSAPLADVLVGATANGSMATAVVLSGDNSEAVNPTAPNAIKYLVTLTSPIKDANGAVAIPAGATLVSVVSGFSAQTGTMQLMVKGVLYNNKEYAAPEGAILIRGEDGASLRASRTGGSNPIVEALLPSILQGAASAAGTLTQNQGTTVTNGNVTTTSSSSSPNIGAGFIQGASQSLAQQIAQATQTANSVAQGRPQSWKLSEGKGVQIFVNSTFQI